MLKKSEFFHNPKIRILLCLELLLILFGVWGLIFGRSGLISAIEQTETLTGDGIDLPAGSYTLRLYYETEGELSSSFGITAENYGYKKVLGNSVALYPGITRQDCEFILTGSVENIRVELNLSEGVTVQGIELWADKGCYRVYILLVVFWSLLLDWILVLWMYHRKEKIPAEKQLVFFGIPALAFAASLPVLVDYNIIGADLIYHLMRIEMLTQSILNGEFFTRMHSTWLAGHGYASNFFYGETFLAFPALLRIAGFNLDSAYRIYVGTVNLATAVTAYLSFSRCFKNKYVGMFGCALYTLAPYRIYNIYNRAAVGEYTAMIFLPLLVWGFYKIYTEDTDKKGYLWNWIIPVAGFSGLIQSHTLSCEITGFFVVLMCLILWKKTFQKKTFAVLALVVIMTVVINAWFLVPFIDLMVSDSYYFGFNAGGLIQKRGIYPAHIFYTLQAGGSSSHFHENGMLNTEPIGLGAALLLCMGMWIILRTKIKRNLKKNASGKKSASELWTDVHAGDIAFVLCCIALFMSTNLFPWDKISGLGNLPATLVGSLQFPTRITTAATILAVTVACAAGKLLPEGNLEFRNITFPRGAILALIVLVSAVFSAYQVNDVLFTKNGVLKLYSPTNMGHSAVLGAEYLPEGASLEHMTYHKPEASEKVTISQYNKDGPTIQAHVTSAEEGYIDFPLLYYKGYSAKNADNGEKLSVSVGENYDVRVILPAGFDGNITVSFTGKWYWHAAEYTSVLTGGSLILWRIFRKKRKL